VALGSFFEECKENRPRKGGSHKRRKLCTVKVGRGKTRKRWGCEKKNQEEGKKKKRNGTCDRRRGWGT